MCVNCGKFKPAPGPPRMRNKLDIAEKATRVPRPAIRQDRARIQTEISTDGETSSRSESLRDIARQRERRNRNADNMPSVDEEGNLNVYRDALTILYNQRDSAKGRDLDLLEKGSIDWTAERSTLQEYLTQVDLQHSFVPRRGELVLWCISIPEEHTIYRDQTGQYKLYNLRKKQFTDHPKWRAGIVAAVPSASLKSGTVDFADVLETPNKQMALNTAGFRIETIPDPNDDTNKSLTKQYKYIPLQNIRPLSFWKFILFGIPQQVLHRSISYALTCMTSISVVERTKLVGHWNEETYINAKGCYLGSELITLGDAVRLVPKSASDKCTDILVVDSIRLELQGLREEYLKSDSQLLCRSSAVHFVGRAFTLDKSFSFISPIQAGNGIAPQSLSKDEIIPTFRPVGTAKYGDLYPLHDMYKEYEVSHDQVLGRLYEADAVMLWTGQYQQKRSKDEQIKPDLGVDCESILFGRRYATKADERIPELLPEDTNGIRWLLSDYRAQSLAVHTINGREVAAYHDIRTKQTLQEWRRMTYTHNNETPMPEVAIQVRKRINYNIRAAFDGDLDLSQESSNGRTSGKTRGRPPGSKLIDGKIYTAEQLTQLGLAPGATRARSNPVEVADLDEEDTDDQAPTMSRQPHFRSSQMANAGMNDADEDLMGDEEEFYDIEEPDISSSLQRPLRSRLAMYGDEDEEDEGYEEDEVDTVMEDTTPSDRQLGRPSPRAPLTKSQLMQSVEDDDGEALDDMQDSELDDDDYLGIWTAPQNARGGTEESEGGDYRPGESQ